jgi:hypothetical protein
MGDTIYTTQLIWIKNLNTKTRDCAVPAIVSTNINWINIQNQFDCFVGSVRYRILQKMLVIQIFGTKHLKYVPNPS